MHSVCCCSHPVWRRRFLKKGTLRDLFSPHPGQKTTTLVRDHEYFIPTKFCEESPSSSREKAEDVLSYRQFGGHKNRKNKHSVSIAEAIHVPYRLQQISKRHYSRKNIWKDSKVKLVQYYVNTIHTYTPNLMSTSWKTTEKCGKVNWNKRKCLVCN